MFSVLPTKTVSLLRMTQFPYYAVSAFKNMRRRAKKKILKNERNISTCLRMTGGLPCR